MNTHFFVNILFKVFRKYFAIYLILRIFSNLAFEGGSHRELTILDGLFFCRLRGRDQSFYIFSFGFQCAVSIMT